MTVGGSAESEATEVAVRPVRSSPAPVVMTLTPPARWRKAARNAAASSRIVGEAVGKRVTMLMGNPSSHAGGFGRSDLATAVDQAVRSPTEPASGRAEKRGGGTFRAGQNTV